MDLLDIEPLIPSLTVVDQQPGQLVIQCPTGEDHWTAYDGRDFSCYDGRCSPTRLLAALEGLRFALAGGAAAPRRCDKFHATVAERDACPGHLFWSGVDKALTGEQVQLYVEGLHEVERERAVRDGTALVSARALFSATTSDVIARREIVFDALPGLLGPPGTVTEWTAYRGTGKSLIMFDLAQAVAHHWAEIWGLPLRLNGPVFIVSPEGVSGQTRRLRAWEEHHHLPASPKVHISHAHVDITKPTHLAALATVIRASGAVLVVLDPVAMTGGGREDEENYSQYRKACLELASATGVAVLIITNTGHTVRTRGRNSSMLVDGVDLSVAFVRKEDTGIVEAKPNKNRDTEQVDGLSWHFKGCADKDPITGKFLSGVMERLTNAEKTNLVAAAKKEALAEASRIASAVLTRDRCTCPTGTAGRERFPKGCPEGGAPNSDVMVALGRDPDLRERSRVAKAALAPLMAQNMVRPLGATRNQTWHWGAPEPPLTVV